MVLHISYFLPPLGSYQELGGNSLWVDRFLARFVAFFYYFMNVAMYMLSPRMACKYTYYLPIMKWVFVFIAVLF